MKLENKACFLQDGDVVIADAAEDSTVGKCTEISESSDQKIVSGLHTIPCRPKNKFAKGFLGYYLNSNAYHDQLLPLMQGTKVSSISKTSLKETTIMFPSSIEEQKKVGACFHELDNLITLHQRELDSLKKLKKSLLQKMFPKNGEKIPELRFPEFTGDWEQRKVNSLIEEFSEKTTQNNQYPVLTSSRKGIFLQTDYFSGNQVASIDNTGYNIVPKGYFTYRHMSDDEIFYFNINDIVDRGIVSTLYPVFKAKDKVADSYFLRYVLNYGEEFRKYAILQKQGGSRTYMYLKKLKELELTIPHSFDEQVVISTFLLKIDNIITLHQRELDSLKKLKKGLLQNMFV